MTEPIEKERGTCGCLPGIHSVSADECLRWQDGANPTGGAFWRHTGKQSQQKSLLLGYAPEATREQVRQLATELSRRYGAVKWFWFRDLEAAHCETDVGIVAPVYFRARVARPRR